jgi:hypothetical protein
VVFILVPRDEETKELYAVRQHMSAADSTLDDG